MNVSHGITTKAHAVAFEDPDAGHRSPEGATELIYSLARNADLLGSNLVHARFELSHLDLSLAREILADDLVVLGSLMHHAPGDGQYEHSADFFDRYQTAADLNPERVESIADSRTNADSDWDERVPELVEIGERFDVPIASHDDDSPSRVRQAANSGIGISEFPLTLESAAEAKRLGLETVMGAPNLVRGESLFDNLRSETAIDHEILDVLCADYHPPSLLQAAFVDTDEPLHERVARVTSTPAEMLGLSNRGRITAGARADLVVVDPQPTPRPTDVIVGGRLVMSQDSQTA